MLLCTSGVHCNIETRPSTLSLLHLATSSLCASYHPLIFVSLSLTTCGSGNARLCWPSLRPSQVLSQVLDLFIKSIISSSTLRFVPVNIPPRRITIFVLFVPFKFNVVVRFPSSKNDAMFACKCEPRMFWFVLCSWLSAQMSVRRHTTKRWRKQAAQHVSHHFNTCQTALRQKSPAQASCPKTGNNTSPPSDRSAA